MKLGIFGALLLSCGAMAMSSTQSNEAAQQVQEVGLKACLMTQAQAALTSGKLEENSLKTVALEIATTCAKQLAMPQVDESTVATASSILQTLSQP